MHETYDYVSSSKLLKWVEASVRQGTKFTLFTLKAIFNITNFVFSRLM